MKSVTKYSLLYVALVLIVPTRILAQTKTVGQYSIKFDLTKTIEAPPAPWGWKH